VYPALAVAERLLEADPQTHLAFVGTVGGFEKPLVEKSGVPLDSVDEVQAGAMHGVGLLKASLGLLKTLAGTFQAFSILGRRKPQVVLMTGGWVGLPVALAAWLRRIPVAVFLPDIEPALSIKMLRRFATKIAVTTPDSAPYVPANKMVVTGYPLRRTLTHMPAPPSLGEEQLATGDYPSFVVAGTAKGPLLHVPVTRSAGIAHFKLDPAKKTLLVFGGSRGARSINIAVIDALPELLGRGDLQIIHVTGELDAERGKTVTADGYHPYAYLHDDMGLAMAASDLCLCRSGASTLGELPHFGLPSILVPYPFAWRYQKVNADYLAARGAAIILPDAQMAARLADSVRSLIDDGATLASMRHAARSLDRPHAALAIGEMLESIAKGKHTV
jgi:UDP-N-acetylglucosamine--N-acetylmuramyl-(pentapeptide) pyrophosphoryl-undecaprenol N-acetylglucosamine transferase